MKSFRFIRPAAALLCGWWMGVGSASAQNWTQTGAPTNYWWSIASSADGAKLVALVGAVPYAKAIYTSADSGATWISNSVPSVEWWSVASSADGTRLIAAASYGGSGIFTSTNSGATWTSNNIPAYAWFSVASSSDGVKLATVAGGGQILGPIYTSTNSGATWISNSVPGKYWQSVASSADGTRLIALTPINYYTSTNSGATWTSNGIPSVSWSAVAASADGTKLVAAVITSGIHRIFTSTNSGATWVTNNAPVSRLSSVASSADGVKLLAVEQDRIWVTTNSGANWTSNNMTGFWHGVALSADGGKAVAINASPGTIWTSQTAPIPQLRIAPANPSLKISWLAPSLNFALQQSPDLSDWTDVTDTAVLNFTNLQSEIVLPATNPTAFYRLESR